MKEEYFLKEIAKLIVILRQKIATEPFVSREYVLEKLNRIFFGYGISIHPTLEKEIKDFMKDDYLKKNNGN